MGIVIGFTGVTPEELEQAFKTPEWIAEHLDPAARELDVDLDKAWRGLQPLLDQAGVPVDLWDGGSFIGEDTDEDFEWVTGWTVEEVRDAAELLRGTPFEQLARHFVPGDETEDKTAPARELEYLQHYYAKLVEFFDAAASAGSAAIMTTG